MTFFHFAVASYHLVVIGDDRTFSGLLRDYIEIVVFADKGTVDKSARFDISRLIFGREESLRISQIDHDHCQFDFSIKCLLNSLY